MMSAISNERVTFFLFVCFFAISMAHNVFALRLNLLQLQLGLNELSSAPLHILHYRFVSSSAGEHVMWLAYPLLSKVLFKLFGSNKLTHYLNLKHRYQHERSTSGYCMFHVIFRSKHTLLELYRSLLVDKHLLEDFLGQ